MSSKYLKNVAVKKKRTEKLKRRDGTALLLPIFVSRSSFGTIPLKRDPFKLQKQILNTCHSTPGGFPLTDNSKVFLNLAFNKGILKSFVFWCFVKYGQAKTIKILEKLQLIGFSYATKAGISLSIDDLKIPPIKAMLLTDAEKSVEEGLLGYKKAQLTGLERFQRVIETWHKTSESLKDEMIDYFRKTDTLNPVYMMAFSGARGNVSQVRQLVSMRGLMSDPQGKILSFPIQSNFREGLTLTEYVISCYGARKGVVDTALRTANAGYLTRRLVDVAQHVIVLNFDCGTKKGIYLTEMTALQKTLYPLRQRLIGRVLAADIYNVKPNSNKKPFFLGSTESNQANKTNVEVIARLNQEISEPLAQKIAKLTNKVLIRSPLTCATPRLVCQLCYGWSLSEGYLVSIGEAVGIIAAQSIGEPGTQLTMRTFHTGGVFSGEMFDQLIAPYDAIVTYSAPVPGTLIRTTQGKIAFLIKAEGLLSISKCDYLESNVSSQNSFEEKKSFKLPPYTVLFLRHNEKVLKDQLIAELAFLSSKVAQKSETAEFIVKSELEGQIYNGSITLFEKYTNYNDLITQSKDWGTVWLLSGKICQLPLNSTFFALPGDLVDDTSVLSEVKWFVPVKTLLDTNSVIKPIKKEIFYDFSLNKNKWSDSSVLGRPFFLNKKKTTSNFEHAKNISKRKKLFNRKNPIMNDYSLLNKLKIKLNSFENIAIKSDGRDKVPSVLNYIKSKQIPDKAGLHNPKRGSFFFKEKKNNEQFKNFHLKSSQSFTNKSGIENVFSIKNKVNITFPLLLLNLNRISYKRFGYFFSFVAGNVFFVRKQNNAHGRCFFFADFFVSKYPRYFEVAKLKKKRKKDVVSCFSQSEKKPPRRRTKSFHSFSETSADVFFVPKLLEQRTKFWQKNYGPNEISANTSSKKSWETQGKSEAFSFFHQKFPESSLFSSSRPILNSKSSSRLSKDLFHWFPKKYLTLKGGICIYSWNYDSFPHYSNFINNLSLFILFKGFWNKKSTYQSYTKFLENPAKIFWVNKNFSKSRLYKVNVQNKNLVNYNDKVNSYKQIKVSDFLFSSRILFLTSFPCRDIYLSKMNEYYLGLNIWNSSDTLIYKTIRQQCSKFSRTGYTTLKSFCLKTKVIRSGMSSIVSTKGLRKANRAKKNLAANPLKRVVHKVNRTKNEVSKKKVVLSFSSILSRKKNVEKPTNKVSGSFSHQNLKKFHLINPHVRGSFTSPFEKNSHFSSSKHILPILNKDLHSNLDKQDLDNTIFLYKIKNLVSAISLHKKLFFPGQKLVDDVSFDTTLVYVQCFPENLIQKEKKFKSQDETKLRLCSLEVKSRKNLKFSIKKCISNPRVRFKTIENFCPNFVFKLSESSHFILLIRKIREYSVSQPNYYKKLLYQSKEGKKTSSANLFKKTSLKFKSKVSTKIATCNYCSQILNKQSPSLRLLEKYPKIDVVLKLNYKGLKKRQLQTFTNNLENVHFPQNIKNLMVKRSELFAQNLERPIFSQKNFLTSSNIEFMTKSSVQLLTCKLMTRNKNFI